ncbi:MAG TPA: protein translocase subunit SecF [Rickettsiales bacterium]|nr:protein translocase subunit SecF [Rickettsiales bacterium]
MKLIPLHIFSNKTKIDFIGTRWFGFGISILFTLISFFVLATHGLNWGIDFTGGVLVELRTEQPADLAKMRDTLDGKGLGEVSLQSFGDPRDVMIRIQSPKNQEQNTLVQKVKTLLADAVPGKIDYRNMEFVGPTVGQELIRSGVLATVFACLAIMGYVWFRFEWQFGVGTLLALVHDTVMVIGFYAISHFDFGLNAVAAVLTIIGYSMNDSVVIYDRIRENMRRYKKMPFDDLLNLSMNETLARTVLTSSTTLLAALALALFGGEVIRGFSWSLVFGIVVGTYSSIYISAPTLIYLKIREAKEAKAA